jgi:hypothetical protein
MTKLVKLKQERVTGEGNRGRLRVLEYEFENGAVQGYDLFDVRKTMQGSSGVVPIDDEGNVYLVREFLPALGTFGISIPRGGIEIGESPQAAALRELKEEAGLYCAEIIPLWQGVVLPNTSSWRVSLFLGRGVQHITREGGDEVGGVETIKMPLNEACNQVTSGEIQGALTGLALMLAKGKLGL